MRLTVITPTWDRPALLSHTLEAFAREREFLAFEAEHIICSDGPDKRARALAEHWGATYCELPEHVGDAGHAAMDAGLQVARGEYVVRWDDDNVYQPDCLRTLEATSRGVDVGVCRIEWWNRKTWKPRVLPERWGGRPGYAEIDSACACIRREFQVSRGLKWRMAAHPYDADYFLLESLCQAGARFQFAPKVVAIHV